MVRHNSTLRTLVLPGARISKFARKGVELELLLCKLRNAHVTQIDASNNHKALHGVDTCLDDAEATRIAEALRCEHSARACV